MMKPDYYLKETVLPEIARDPLDFYGSDQSFWWTHVIGLNMWNLKK